LESQEESEKEKENLGVLRDIAFMETKYYSFKGSTLCPLLFWYRYL
jgi:hypothetical protein